MHARVSVAANALTSEGLPITVSNVIHRALTTNLTAHGRLVFTSAHEASSLIQAVRNEPGLPQDARKLWMETLIALRQQGRVHVIDPPGEVDLADAGTLAQLCQQWGPVTDLAIIAEDACEALGVPIDVGFSVNPSIAPEVATAAAALSGHTLSHLKELTERAFTPSGAHREEFWNEVLGPVATEAGTATLLDAYLFTTLWDITDRKSWAKNLRTEHLCWLLDHLDSAMAPGAEAHLLARADPKRPHFNADATATALREAWGPAGGGRLHKVTVMLSPPKHAKFPHDRHIRFSNGTAVQINAGFDRLRGETIWDPDGMGWLYRWRPDTLRSLRKAEDRAASGADSSTATVLERLPYNAHR